MPRSRCALKTFCGALLILSMTVALSGQSIAELKKQAAAGDAKAQFNLGLAYCLGFVYANSEGVPTKGEGVPKDEAEGVRWYRKAADQGFAGSQYNLGLSYYHGTGVPQDYSQSASVVSESRRARLFAGTI